MGDVELDSQVDSAIAEVLAAEEQGAAIEEAAAPEQGDTAEIEEDEACGSLDEFTPEELAPEEEDEDLTGNLSLIRISDIDGVPLFYARGVPPRPTSFSIDPAYKSMLVDTVKTVRFRAPASFGKLVRITSAGAFVAKPGMHGLGRAFDHDRWTFQHVDIKPIAHDHASSSRATRQRYWALAALMRSHCAYVLHGLYNQAHEDHLHQDNGGPYGFTTSSEATVKLVQAICREIFRMTEVHPDGDFGSTSRDAARKAMQKVDLAGDINDRTQFKRFLLRSGRLGFELSMK